MKPHAEFFVAARTFASILLIPVVTLSSWGTDLSQPSASPTVLSLDGDWLLGADPENQGIQQEWWEGPQPDAVSTKVPWIIEDILPGYHGVVWYWRDFSAPRNPDPAGRYLLRFWNVDYLANVWVNGKAVGGHEGASGEFSLDVTEAVQPGESNQLAVRVLNPKDEPIDGIALKQTPHRNKTCTFTFGCDYNHGGIEDSVEILVVPAVRVADLFLWPDPQRETIRVQMEIVNTLPLPATVTFNISLAPAAGGETLLATSLRRGLAPGETKVEAQLNVEKPRLWRLEDPYLYRVSVRTSAAGKEEFPSETAARCGFRDFRVEDGYFRLNGKRIYLRCSHTGNMVPIGIHLPYKTDVDALRKDLVNVKAVGFNAIRFIAGPAERYQLDLCDEIGLLVYEEAYSAWLLEDSPKMAERFDCSLSEMVRRDRNHPSIVIWGLLNETGDGPVFRHAVQALPLVRSLDENRLVLLNSGRFDCHFEVGSVSNPGSEVWDCVLGRDGQPSEDAKTIYPSPERSGDAHIYPQVPHGADAIRILRTYGEGGKNSFLSEYGVSSGVDLTRLARQYEQRGKQTASEAMFYRRPLDSFMRDWERWRMAECFGRPEDYFRQSLAKNAKDRMVGLNALRANPHIIGYSLTGTVDQGYSGEGLTTTYREFKPGTIDSMSDALAPLRWCLFAEPVNVYRGNTVKLEAILANEDVLSPGEYPVRIEVFGPNSKKVFERRFAVTVPEAASNPQTPFAFPVFAEDVLADWPSGKYRLTATFDWGGAAAGGDIPFYVTDLEALPRVNAEVTLWGEDAELVNWLADQGIPHREFNSEQTDREVLLMGENPPTSPESRPFRELARHLARGSTAIFLSPRIFANGDDSTARVPLPQKGAFKSLASCVYHKDDWAKRHPIFDGLPAGGLLDYEVYRQVVSNIAWVGEDPQAVVVAAAVHSAPDYASGSLVSIHEFGAGRFILNTLCIRENLGGDPVADILLRNLIRYATEETGESLRELPQGFDRQIAELGLDR